MEALPCRLEYFHEQLIFPAEVGDYSKHIGMVIVVEGTLERGYKRRSFYRRDDDCEGGESDSKTRSDAVFVAH